MDDDAARLEQRITRGMAIMAEYEDAGRMDEPKYAEAAALMDQVIYARLALDPQGMPYLWCEERSET